MCAYLEIEPDVEIDGRGEAALLAGQVGGSTSLVAYGASAETILAFARLKPAEGDPGTWLDVLIARVPRPAKVQGRAACDPESKIPRTDE